MSHSHSEPAPLVYTVDLELDTHYANITVEVPSDGRASIELMLPIWSPGFYRIEPYAERVHEFAAHTPEGAPLLVEQVHPNRWRIQTADAPLVRVTYRLLCDQTSVTTNWVGAEYAVLNGSATFITLVESAPRPHEVAFVLPPTWSHCVTGLTTMPGAQPHRFRADTFDTLVDCPVVLGNPEIHTFVVDERPHALVVVGEPAQWDRRETARALEQVVQANADFWRGLPYDDYHFLVVVREGGGGLEHSNSTLVTAHPARISTPEGYAAWIVLAAHEFFHAFNVKRLRPRELGPFDHEQPPRTTSLWIAEGLTCYYTDVLLCRAGLRAPEWLLASLSTKIADLQNAPGRLVQTLEQSSYDVWDNSFSGINPTDITVSYYTKGHVVGWLLDAHIRRVTGGSRSLDDVMRLAYTRYGGAQGFSPDQFRETAEKVAGTSLEDWLRHAIASTEELDYTEALAWFGLRFATPGSDEQTSWTLQHNPLASDDTRQHLADWHGHSA